ncbi:hypothetical protein DE146DRAFT_371593 [Phaeosphaeria sp. MPI-PUGE-AT-0046c]|nr:hypothetical protein DE146DRAFT_371593 [Phaeosphaeria sp. MPI-PUGE-AT-0046c]
MGDISSPTSRPGLMICTPSLLQPGPRDYDTFLRWTRLHFRDLVDVPAIPGGKITRALQFVTPGATGKEGEYFNVIHASHLPIWLSEGYKSNSKRLDIENTRKLSPGEEPVGCEPGKLVFDICTAVFSIYELVDGDTASGYQVHPRAKDGERKCLLAVNVNGDEEIARKVFNGAVKDIEELGSRSMLERGTCAVSGAD